MGIFLHTVLFPGGEESKCREAVRRCAGDSQLSIQLEECRWNMFGKNPAVLLNDFCCGYEALAEQLSAALDCPVMVLYIYDDDYWGYFLWQNGAELDRFASLADYFGKNEPPYKLGDAEIVGRCFGVPPEKLDCYLIPWEEIEIGRYAYPSDKATIGDGWQMADFMLALGFDFDQFCPPEEEPSAPA